jgi:hypothetical protein
MTIYVYIHIYIHIHVYSERENKTLLVGFSEGTIEGRKWNKILENENIVRTHLYMNITYCTINCWILGDHGDRETVNNGG